jgi:hypothetical protein
MKVLRRYLFFPLLLVAAVNLVGAPITGPQRRPRASESKKGVDRLQLLQREFPKLADSALALKNVGLKIWTLSSLADLLWATDPVTSRALFQKTYGLLKAITPTENQPESDSVEANNLPKGKLITLYVLFFSFVGKHDVAWKEQLVNEAPEFVRYPGAARNLDVTTANLLLKEKNSKASDFIEATISDGVSGFTHSMQVLDMLFKLRRIDLAKADQLFSRLLDQLESQGSTSADDLFTIGNYLFTRSGPAAAVNEEMVLVSPVFVGAISFHADISVDRMGITTELVEQYLRSSVAVLSRPVTNETTLSQYRAAAFLLLPKARRYAPQYVPILTTLSTGIDPKRTNSTEARASSSEQTPPTDVDAILKHLDTIKTTVQRDEYCLRMIWSFYAKGDLQSARALNERISSVETRARIFDVISIREAIDSLEAGDLDSARLQARKLPQGEQRAFLWLAIGAKLVETRDLDDATAVIEWGLADARKTDGAAKASLLLLGSELLSTVDFPASTFVLAEAVRAINSLGPEVTDPLKLNSFVRITIGSQSATFSTDIKGTKAASISGAIKLPLSKDPLGVITLILQLKNEYARSSALVAFVAECAA